MFQFDGECIFVKAPWTFLLGMPYLIFRMTGTIVGVLNQMWRTSLFLFIATKERYVVYPFSKQGLYQQL